MNDFEEDRMEDVNEQWNEGMDANTFLRRRLTTASIHAKNV